MSDEVILTDEGLSAVIQPFGAELISLKDASGRELLWEGDPTVWAGRAPLLFPIVGALNNETYHLSGKDYQLPRHGFARRKLFSVTQTTSSSAKFRLGWDEATIQVYPFHFELEVGYSVKESSLTVSATVTNLDRAVMPASFGFHPAFRWPLPYGDARSTDLIEFERDEPGPLRRLNARGLIAPEMYPTPIVERVLLLHDELFRSDALIFDQIESRRLWYGAKSGKRLQIDFPETPYLGVWTKPGGNFICIEPWHGLADQDGYLGDFCAKAGVFLVEGSGQKVCTMSITVGT